MLQILHQLATAAILSHLASPVDTFLTSLTAKLDVDMEARRMLLEVVESTKTPGRSVGPSMLNIIRKLLDRLLWL